MHHVLQCICRSTILYHCGANHPHCFYPEWNCGRGHCAPDCDDDVCHCLVEETTYTKRGSSSKRGTKIWKFQLDTQCSNFVNKIIQANAVSKIHIPEGFIVFLSLLSDADDAGTELRTETQRSRTSLATPAFTLQLQGSTRSTTSYYVNEGLGPISVNGGDHGNELSHEYDSIPANVNPIPMATNPAYQSTSYPSSTSGAIWDKNFVSANTRKEGHTSRKQIAG